MIGPPSASIVGMLEGACDRYAQRVALVARRGYRTRTWSYAELWAASGRAAAILADRGVAPADRVVLAAPNDPLWVIGFVGALRLGAVAVPLDARSPADLTAAVVRQTEPKLVLTADASSAANLCVNAPAMGLDALDGRRTDAWRAPAATASEAIAEIVFTSGTTGSPKGVILTHGNVASNVAAVAQLLPPRPTDRLLSVLPLSHMLEQTVGLLLPLTGGAAVVFPPGRSSTAIFHALKRYRITVMVVVPQVLQLFADALDREARRQGRERAWRRARAIAARLPYPLRRAAVPGLHRAMGGRFRFFVCGGAPLPAALAAKWEALGVPVVQGYGTTEAAPVVTGTSLRARRVDSPGMALPGQAIRIGADGEVLVGGPNVSPGYWRDPAATAAAFADGWYRTGDLGEIDDAGYLRLRGRKKDMIALASGMNVYAEDLERALCDQPGVRDAAVVGFANEGASARVHAVLLGPRDDHEARRAIEGANARLAEYQQIRDFSVWPDADFPRTATLKVKKHEILATLAGAARPAIDPADEASAVGEVVARVAGVPISTPRPDARIGTDLGIDSLGRVELLAALASELGVEIDEELLSESTTVADLDALVAAGESVRRPAFWEWPHRPCARMARSALQRALLFPLLRCVGSISVEGADQLAGLEPPAIYAPNHASHLDAPAVLAAMTERVRRRSSVAAAADYFFENRWLGGLVALLLNAFPFSRTGAVRSTLEHCGELLDDGWSIVVFPEGTRSATGEIGSFRPGMGLMAVELGVPVVPVRVRGTFGALPKGRGMPRRSPLRVTFGRPLRFPPGFGHDAAAKAIEAAVRAL